MKAPVSLLWASLLWSGQLSSAHDGTDTGRSTTQTDTEIHDSNQIGTTIADAEAAVRGSPAIRRIVASWTVDTSTITTTTTMNTDDDDDDDDDDDKEEEDELDVVGLDETDRHLMRSKKSKKKSMMISKKKKKKSMKKRNKKKRSNIFSKGKGKGDDYYSKGKGVAYYSKGKGDDYYSKGKGADYYSKGKGGLAVYSKGKGKGKGKVSDLVSHHSFTLCRCLVTLSITLTTIFCWYAKALPTIPKEKERARVAITTKGRVRTGKGKSVPRFVLQFSNPIVSNTFLNHRYKGKGKGYSKGKGKGESDWMIRYFCSR